MKERKSPLKLRAKKSLGQNFITDENIHRKIVALAGNISNEYILEIGPGTGGLTTAILQQNCTKLIVVEKDERCIDILQNFTKDYGDEKFILKTGDALQINYHKIFDKPYHIISNLPYNVSIKILLQIMEAIHDKAPIKSVTMMFQQEVAKRLIAKENNSSYGRLSVLCNLIAPAKILIDLPPEIFTPSPKINSSLVAFEIKEERPDFDFAIMEIILKNFFFARRKMLRGTVKKINEELEKYLQKRTDNICDLSEFNQELKKYGSARSQELPPEKYLNFCKIIQNII